MKRILQTVGAAVLAAALVFGAAACGTAGTTQGTTAAPSAGTTAPASGEKMVTIGMTYPITSMNPLYLDASEAMKYAVGISFEPILELNSDNVFVGVLAESVTANEDGTVFTVKLNDDAKWSDGQPVTADDVIFTVLKTTSKTVSNPSMAGYSQLKGFDPGTGQVADDATEVEGLVKVDEKTVEFHAEYPMSLESFNNNFMRYLLPIPKHVLGEKTTAELATTDWFLAPEVVSGPFQVTSADVAQYVTYEKNENYWQGEPKLDKVNIRIVTSSQLFAGLKSGEIDFVQQTTGVFAQEDIDSVSSLENADEVYDKPVTSVLAFINNESVPDARVRKAILHAIDRELLVKEFLKGKGEVVDGFLTSATPYFDETLEVTPYDPDQAKALLAEANWDASKTLTFKIDSGDATFAQAANVIVAQLGEVGIKVQLQTLSFTQLLTDAGNHDFDMMTVQYTLSTVAPAFDISWLTAPSGWPLYNNPEVDALVEEAMIVSGDVPKLKSLYREINEIMQEEVPIFNAYALSPLGAKAKRVVNAAPSVFGGFMDMHLWDIG